MHILKFGGSSLDGLARIESAAALVDHGFRRGPVKVVVSALAGVTDNLSAAIGQALVGASDVLDLEALARRHLECLPVSDQGARESYRPHLASTLDSLARLLEGVGLLGACPTSTHDAILAAGERLSAPLLAAALRRRGLAARVFDGSELIATDARHRGGVDPAETHRRINRRLTVRPPEEVAVITGFIGSDAKGNTTTLGRGASDYSATLLARALAADSVEIWTDVDGVLSAEPRLVPDAFPLPHLTYGQARDLACYGARVLHPQTLEPLVAAGIPVTIRNAQRPDQPGTRVDGVDLENSEIRAVTGIPEVVRFQLRAMDQHRSRSPDLRLLAKLAEPPLLLSWEGPGRSFSVVVRASEAELLSIAIEDENLETLQREDLSLVAARGDARTLLPLLSTLAEGDVAARDVILPGPSGCWITVLVDRDSASRAVRLVHDKLVLGLNRDCLTLPTTPPPTAPIAPPPT